MNNNSSDKNITYTVMLWTGLATMITGLVVSVLGVKDPSLIKITLDKFSLETTNIGLSILVIGAFFTYFMSSNKPPEVRVLGYDKRESRSFIAGKLPLIALIFGILGSILLTISIIYLK